MRLRVATDDVDAARGRTGLLARETLADLGVEAGEYVRVAGDRETVVTTRRWNGPADAVALTSIDRSNAGADPGDEVTVERTQPPAAHRVAARLADDLSISGAEQALRGELEGNPVSPEDTVSVSVFGGALTLRFVVETTEPNGPVVVGPETTVETVAGDGETLPEVRAGDLGGVEDLLADLRRTLVAPLVTGSVTDLGATPDGVLLVGAPGAGKTSLALAVADSSPAVSVLPVVPGGRYHDGTVDVGSLRADARDQAPVVVILEDIETLAPAPQTGSVDADTAPLARLVTELCADPAVSVLGTTSDPAAVAPALRGGGALSHRVTIPTPDRETRRAILAAGFAGVTADVAPAEVAARTHGFVAGDLSALVSESVRAAIARRDGDGTLEGGPALTVRDADVTTALERVDPSGLEGFAVDSPDVSYEDIGGLSDVKRELVRAVEWPLLYPDLFEAVHDDPPAGLLLYGPPGTGKTMLARAVANASDVNFVAVSGPELFDRYIGESERAVREVFERARQAAPTVVFFDEVDALGASRDESDSTGVTDRVVSQLLTELDGIEPSEGVIPIGATNRPDLIDKALLRPGRFERALKIGLPDREARREILTVHLLEVPTAGDVDAGVLADATEGYSGSDLAAVVREAGLLAMEGALREADFDAAAAEGDLVITQAHLRRAAEDVDRSVSEEMRETYRSYADEL